MSSMFSIYPEYKINGYTYFDTFTYRGKKYNLNTIVKVKDNNHTWNALLVQLVEAGINKHGKYFWKYAIWSRLGYVGYWSVHIPPDEMIVEILEPSRYSPIVAPQEYYSDFDVPDVMWGWLIYIVAMIGSLIFNGFLCIWVCGTWYFLKWRKKKLKKPLKHDYGFVNVHLKARELNGRKT